jgi:hypothetical protein
MPNIYAVDRNGNLSDGSRVLEALAVLYDMDTLFNNLRTVRTLAREGIVTFAQGQRPQERERLAESGDRPELRPRLEVHVNDSPVRAAERRYIAEHGTEAMYRLINRLLEGLFPS